MASMWKRKKECIKVIHGLAYLPSSASEQPYMEESLRLARSKKVIPRGACFPVNIAGISFTPALIPILAKGPSMYL